MEIVFCDACDASIPHADLEHEVARRVGGRLLCTLCLRRRARVRLALVALVPLSLLAAAALGALAALTAIAPRIESLEREVRELSAETGREPEPDTAILDELEGLRRVDAEQKAAIEELADGLRDSGERAAKPVEELADRVEVLREEIVAIKEHLAKVPAPGAGGNAEPGGDLARWLEFVDDADPGVRLSALVELERFETEEVTDAMIAALSDSDAPVRSQAARVLGEREVKRAAEPLVGLLLDPNTRVRAVAHRALNRILGRELDYDATAPEDERKAKIEEIRKAIAGD